MNEKWQHANGDYVMITEEGVEICCGNTVYIKSIGDWHKLAIAEQQATVFQGYSYNNERTQPSKAEKIGQYLYMLYEAQKVDHSVHNEIEDALKQYKSELGI